MRSRTRGYSSDGDSGCTRPESSGTQRNDCRAPARAQGRFVANGTIFTRQPTVRGVEDLSDERELDLDFAEHGLGIVSLAVTVGGSSPAVSTPQSHSSGHNSGRPSTSRTRRPSSSFRWPSTRRHVEKGSVFSGRAVLPHGLRNTSIPARAAVQGRTLVTNTALTLVLIGPFGPTKKPSHARLGRAFRVARSTVTCSEPNSASTMSSCCVPHFTTELMASTSGRSIERSFLAFSDSRRPIACLVVLQPPSMG